MPSQQPVVVAANIRAEMARRGVRQREVSAALDMTQSAVSMKLRGARPITVDELIAIARVLDVPVARLLVDEHEVPA